MSNFQLLTPLWRSRAIFTNQRLLLFYRANTCFWFWFWFLSPPPPVWAGLYVSGCPVSLQRLLPSHTHIWIRPGWRQSLCSDRRITSTSGMLKGTFVWWATLVIGLLLLVVCLFFFVRGAKRCTYWHRELCFVYAVATCRQGAITSCSYEMCDQSQAVLVPIFCTFDLSGTRIVTWTGCCEEWTVSDVVGCVTNVSCALVKLGSRALLFSAFVTEMFYFDKYSTWRQRASASIAASSNGFIMYSIYVLVPSSPAPSVPWSLEVVLCLLLRAWKVLLVISSLIRWLTVMCSCTWTVTLNTHVVLRVQSDACVMCSTRQLCTVTVHGPSFFYASEYILYVTAYCCAWNARISCWCTVAMFVFSTPKLF